MNVLFVNYAGFEAINSAIHIFHLANRLVEQGVDCAVAVRGDVEKVSLLGKPRFRCLTYEAAQAGAFGFADRGGPTLVHAWTPRERVRCLVQEISLAHGCPYVVHLEDNEEETTANHAGMSFERLRSLPEAQLSRLVPEALSHPVRYRDFLAGAAGVTVIIDRLLEFKPDAIPGEVLWPGFDPAYLALPRSNRELRYGLSIGEDEFVVVYPGNTHVSNVEEMRSLYTSVGLLNSRGHKVRLVRFGTDYCDPLNGNREFVRPYCLELGYRSREALLGPMAMADALVQPGRPGPFNDCRFPSKLPDFLASGRPVVLPKTNIGRFLRDGEECLHLDEGDGLDIARKLEKLIGNPDLREQIGKGGRDFAERELSWEAVGNKAVRFYDRVLASPATRVASVSGPSKPERPCEYTPEHLARIPRWPGMDAPTLEAAFSRYAGSFPAADLSYGTVRDFCDSYDHVRPLATEVGDLKDCQRPWVFKAVLGKVPHGGRLLEIGAGDPIVAELLSCLGYDVWVVDPYEGQGNGPLEYERFCKQYPDVHILRRAFTRDIDAFTPGTFDCIYSISVLEHIPTEELTGVFEAMGRLLKPGGYSIHAVDHVVRGGGSDWHREHTSQLLELAGFIRGDLTALEERLVHDPETFYLSAEGHNAWRGTQSYDEFPMRVVAGLQICARKAAVVTHQEAASGIERETNPSALYERVRLMPILDGLWMASTVSSDSSQMRLRGWAVHPGDQPAQFFLTMNGAPMSLEKYALHPSLSARLNLKECYHFEAAAAIEGSRPGPIEFRGSFGVRESRCGASSFFWPSVKPVLPEPVRRGRVHGTEEESSFDLIGCTIAENIKQLVERRFHRNFQKLGPVLDWGCGCGRVARFLFPSLERPYGIDIDADNINWCQQNLKGDFSQISLNPPTPLPANYFELIYGISVFTHLAASDQIRWLEELARLGAPGGLVIVTVHGYTSWLFNDPGVEKYLFWEREGILDAGMNSDLEGAVEDPSRYRSMFHTPAYIRRVWREWFDVLDIVPAWAANNQDVVILKVRDR